MNFTPDQWAQFMQGQAPMMQGLMGNYMEQSKALFLKMQEQMQGFPGGGFSPFGKK